jgi:hypothetical protein
MSDKGFEGTDKMSVEFVNESRRMADFILHKAHRGPGDTVDAAMHRAERLWGVPAAWLHRLRYRPELKDMPVSAFAAILNAYQAAGASAVRTYEMEREKHEPNSRLVRFTDFVAGKKASREVAGPEVGE